MTKATAIRRLAKALGRDPIQHKAKGRAAYEFGTLAPEALELVDRALESPREAHTDYRGLPYIRWQVLHQNCRKALVVHGDKGLWLH